MSAKDKYEYATIFGDYAYKNGERMARVRDELLWEPVTIKVTFYTFDGVWCIDHEEEGFEFAHEAFERGVEWVDGKTCECCGRIVPSEEVRRTVDGHEFCSWDCAVKRGYDYCECCFELVDADELVPIEYGDWFVCPDCKEAYEADEI